MKNSEKKKALKKVQQIKILMKKIDEHVKTLEAIVDPPPGNPGG